MTAQREIYARTIATMLPQAEGRERELRLSLLLVRDRASVALNHCCAEAWPILVLVADLTWRHAFAPLDMETLEALRCQVIRLMTCAAGLETLFGAEPAEETDGDH